MHILAVLTVLRRLAKEYLKGQSGKVPLEHLKGREERIDLIKTLCIFARDFVI